MLALLYLQCSVGLAQQYKVNPSIPLGGNGAWDYLRADSEARRLYVSHSSEVVVLDMDSKKRVGQLTGFGFVHGIVIVRSLNRGFLSDGQKNEVVTFDPETLQIKDRIKTVANPNSMAYDAVTGRLFVGHKPSKSVTAINAATGKIEGRIEVPGIPEFPATDGRSGLFVNIEDKNEMIRIDTKTLKIVAHYPLAPCTGPGGLAIDLQRHRLFAACDNKIMAVVNSDTGAVVASLPKPQHSRKLMSGPSCQRLKVKPVRVQLRHKLSSKLEANLPPPSPFT